MDALEKLELLTAAAKYDVACTSSGVDRSGNQTGMGNSVGCGICHSFSSDGRCISLLKVLMTNYCVYDCKYCVNRRSNDVRRTAFAPRELADLTMEFYRRNYIEGLFLSSGILRDPDTTCERMIQVLKILRQEYGFGGYIHAKAIPGADSRLIEQMGLLADRMSVNIELPSKESLQQLAPDKSKEAILTPMGWIRDKRTETARDLVRYQHTPSFVPSGQSTQMIVGATADTDLQILKLTQGLYRKYQLKRVFFSAYTPVVEHALLPALHTKPPLLREHRLYQADWLLRFYGFQAEELLEEENPNFHPLLDPKCNWAIHHPEWYPVEVNTAPMELLLRVPGIGPTGARRILQARRTGPVHFDGLKKMGVALKRAQYFITCNGKTLEGLRFSTESLIQALAGQQGLSSFREHFGEAPRQLSLFDRRERSLEEVRQCLG